VAVDITLDFIESANPTVHDVTLRLYQSCDRCRGSGAEPGTPIITCERCGGRGQVTSSQQTIFGVFAQAAICPDCHGTGKKPKQKCSQCHGQGRQRQSRTLQVSLPAGIADGQIVRIAGKGEAPPFGGVNGDLYVTVHIRSHGTMRRQKDNVHSSVPVSFVDAALGTEVAVETLDGKSQLKIPAGTQPGAKLTLSSKGFPHLGAGGRGDHVVTVDVEIPKRLSRKQRQLLEEFKGAKKKFLF
jgi:molecular chaperone DnaJ